MTKRILCMMAALVMLLVCLVGCGDENPTKKPGPDSDVNKAQLVVALNPVLVYGDNTTVAAFNDINGAMKADNEASSLSAMYKDTAWQWVYSTANGWKQRATYDLTRWQNGAGAEAKKTVAYTFNEDGDISLTRYNTNSVKLTAYAGSAAPQVGLLLSATGSEQEALCYTVEKDGELALPKGTITAISEVAGVKTGFLAEDGTARSAALTITLNGKQLWSGNLQNSTAAADGVAVTSLEYPQLDSLKVTAGDKLFFTVKLSAQANKDADVSKPTLDEDDFWAVSSRTEMVPVETTGKPVISDDGSISVFSNYMFSFTLVRDSNNTKLTLMAAEMADTLMKNTKAVIPVAPNNSDAEVGDFKIVIGVHPKHPESKAIYDELREERADCAMDYCLRLSGTCLYIIGATDTSLQMAVDYFIETFGQNDDGVIPANYNYISRDPHKTYLLGGKNIGSYTAIRVEKYPNYMVMQAARDLQDLIQSQGGYIIDIKKGTDGMASAQNEIRVGGMNDRVAVDRKYNTHFTAENDAQYSTIHSDGLMDGVEDSYYEVKFEGTNLILNGGSNYAVNAGTQVLLSALNQKGDFAQGNVISGDYVSQIAYWKGVDSKNTDEDGYDTRYDTVKYELSDNYGLVFSEEFNKLGTHAETEADITGRWSVSTDGSAPNETADNKKLEETHGFNVGQFRPGVYGTNWWVQQDDTGNGYLLQITRYNAEASGTANGEEAYRNHTLVWDAGRVIGANKWAFRYGIQEVRMVMGTRNGACSAVWSAGGAPIPGNTGHNEIDTYENFGKDIVVPNIHTWQSEANGGHTNHNASGDMAHSTLYSTNAGVTQTEPENKTFEQIDYTDTNEHFYNTFHTVGMVWDAKTMSFYLDGEIYNTVDITPKHMAAFQGATNMKLANGIGVGSYTGGWDPWDFLPDGAFTLNNGQPNEYKDAAAKYDFYLDKLENFFEVQYVDYVHIYQTNPKGQSSKNAAQFFTSKSFH